MIKNMLCVNQKKRWTAQRLLTHPWIVDEKGLLEQKSLNHSIVTMKKLAARRRFKAAIRIVIFTNRLSRQFGFASFTGTSSTKDTSGGAVGGTGGTSGVTSTTGVGSGGGGGLDKQLIAKAKRRSSINSKTRNSIHHSTLRKSEIKSLRFGGEGGGEEDSTYSIHNSTHTNHKTHSIHSSTSNKGLSIHKSNRTNSIHNNSIHNIKKRASGDTVIILEKDFGKG